MRLWGHASMGGRVYRNMRLNFLLVSSNRQQFQQAVNVRDDVWSHLTLSADMMVNGRICWDKGWHDRFYISHVEFHVNAALCAAISPIWRRQTCGRQICGRQKCGRQNGGQQKCDKMTASDEISASNEISASKSATKRLPATKSRPAKVRRA